MFFQAGVGRYSLLQGMLNSSQQWLEKRGMSCAELDWDWEVFTVTRHVAMLTSNG